MLTREDQIRVITALIDRADSQRRQARLRKYIGPQFAAARRRLRTEADYLDELAIKVASHQVTP